MFRCLLFGPRVTWCDYFPIPYWGTISWHLGSIRKQQRREVRLFFFFFNGKAFGINFLVWFSPWSTMDWVSGQYVNLWLPAAAHGRWVSWHACTVLSEKPGEEHLSRLFFLSCHVTLWDQDASMSEIRESTTCWWASVLLWLPLKAAIVREFKIVIIICSWRFLLTKTLGVTWKAKKPSPCNYIHKRSLCPKININEK